MEELSWAFRSSSFNCHPNFWVTGNSPRDRIQHQVRLLRFVCCLAYSLILKLNEVCFSETSDSFRTTRCYNPEDRILQSSKAFK